MTDQELADAIRERWPDWNVRDDADCAGLVDRLLLDNPAWMPEVGERVRVEHSGIPYRVVGPHPDKPHLWYLHSENVATVWFHIDNIIPVEDES
jgi:hypothetical protein